MRELKQFDPSARRRRKTKRRAIVAGSVLGALLIGGASAVALASQTTERYSTATAQIGDVEQNVAATGTVTSASRVNASFGAAGTVADVSVAIGDEVEAGAVLATLDLDELQEAVDSAKEDLATAKESLAADLESQSSTTTTTTAENASVTTTSAAAATVTTVAYIRPTAATTTVVTTATTATAAVTPVAATTSAALTTAQQKVKSAQEVLLKQYDVVKAALETSTSGLAAATGVDSVCAAFLAETVTVSDDSDGDVATETSATTSLTECQKAITEVQGNQGVVDVEQRKLLDLVSTLDTAVTALNKAATSADSGTVPNKTDPDSKPTTEPSKQPTPSKSPSTTDQPTQPDQSSQPDKSTQQSGQPSTGSTGKSTTITAARILADRAAITVAQSKVDIATAAADRSHLTAPIAGTIADVQIASGDTVTASSDTQIVTILGAGGYLITADIPLTKTKLIQPGQAITATVTGTDAALTGTVTNIGATNQSTTATPSFTVIMAIAETDMTLAEGGLSSVVIAVDSRTGVIVVPTSAVTRDGSEYTVQVPAGSAVTVKTVEVGAVGAETTEITSGLVAGDQVVLADRTQAIETTTTTTRTGERGSNGGGFGGTSGPGGFGGGRPQG